MNHEDTGWKTFALELMEKVDFNELTKRIPETIRGDREFTLNAIKLSPTYIEHADQCFWKDKEIMLHVLQQKPEYFEFIIEDKSNNHLKWDIDINTTAIQHAKNMLIIHPKMWKSKEFARRILCKDPNNFLPRFSKHIRDDKEIVLLAMNAGAGDNVLTLTSGTLRGDKEFVTKLLGINPRIFKYAADELKNDPEMVNMAIRLDPNNLYWVHEKWTKSIDIFKLLIQHKAKALTAMKIIHKNIRSDKNLIIQAVSQEGLFLRHASYELKHDSDVITVAIHQNGLAIQHVPKNLRTKDIILLAIRTNWKAIELIKEPSNEDLCMAMEASWKAIRFASSKQKGDFDIAFKAISTSIDAINYVYHPDRLFILKVVQALSKRIMENINQILLQDQDTAALNPSPYTAMMLLRKFYTFIQNQHEEHTNKRKINQHDNLPPQKKYKIEDKLQEQNSDVQTQQSQNGPS